MEAKELANELSNFVNRFDSLAVARDLADGLVCQHRTLQQSLAQVFFLWIKRMADAYESGNYDARNEESCFRCHQIVDMWKAGHQLGNLVLTKDGIPFLPTV